MACLNYVSSQNINDIQTVAHDPQISWTDATGHHRDARGNVVGWTDQSGRCHDAEGHVIGWIEKTDIGEKYHDSKGHVIGWKDSGGSFHDGKNVVGWTDTNGIHYGNVGFFTSLNTLSKLPFL